MRIDSWGGEFLPRSNGLDKFDHDGKHCGVMTQLRLHVVRNFTTIAKQCDCVGLKGYINPVSVNISRYVTVLTNILIYLHLFLVFLTYDET